MRTSSRPRSLTQMLRETDDPALTRLLLSRPDLAFPELDDFSQVASRATTRQSVAAAVDLLDAFELWVAHEVAAMPIPVSIDDVTASGVDREQVAAALARLRELALVWGDPDTLRPVRVLAGVLGEDATATPPPPPEPPPIDVAEQVSPALVDKVAAGSAFEFVRRMDVLVEHCDHQPLRRRRDGGLTSRQVRGMAELLDVSAQAAATYVDLAESAGLIGLTAQAGEEVLLPTDVYDTWQRQSLGQQWALLVGTWADAAHIGAPRWLTRLVLEGLGTPGGGAAVAVDSLATWLAWRRPRRPHSTDRMVGVVLEQAASLGVTALGAPATFGPSADAAGIDALLPDRVDHVVIQADLTAIAPGPLTAEAARDLGAHADIESRGGATVYRFSAESLRRARSLGWSAEETMQTLTARSRTPIPQPLAYLVGDVERQPRQHDDMVHEPTMHVPPERARPRRPVDQLTSSDRLDPDAAAGLVARLRRGEVSAAADADDTPRPVSNSPVGPLAVLREAVETGEPVWFGYMDAVGERSERLVTARAVDDGELLAEDARTHAAVRLPVHRIMTAHIVRSGS